MNGKTSHNQPISSGETLTDGGDRTETIGNSLIQHGKDSDRVYLMAADDRDMPGLLTTLKELAARHGYGKIFAKLPERWRSACQDHGLEVEAEVPGFYRGRENGLFCGKYLDPARRACHDTASIQKVLEQCRQVPATAGQRHGGRKPVQAPENRGVYQQRLCTPADTTAMAALFGRVFPSYPFPVQDPAYLAQTMTGEVSYAGAWQGEQLAALAAAEYDPAGAHAEMTDFATAPEHRRQQLAGGLLTTLEAEMRRRDIKVAYTIARAISWGINLTFARAGYHYAGTLFNNTQICGRIESMNIWYRQL